MLEPGGWPAQRKAFLMLALLGALAGCSGGSMPGSGAGSATQMQRQIEAATAARAKAARSASKLPAAAPAPKPEKPPGHEPNESVAEKADSATRTEPEPRPAVAPKHPAVLTRDGSLVAIDGDDGSVQLWNATSGAVVAAFPPQGVNRSALAIDPVQHLLASASVQGPISLWRFGSRQDDGLDYFARLQVDDFAGTLRGHQGSVNSLAFDLDGKQLASAGADGTVRVWRTVASAPLAFAVGRVACQPAIGPGGKGLALATDDNAVELVQLDDSNRTRRLQRHQARITTIAFAHGKDFELLLSGDEKGRIHVWDFQTGSGQELFAHAASVTGLAFDNPGRRIVSTASDGTLRIAHYPPSQSRLLTTLPGPPTEMSLSPDQESVVVKSSSGNLAAIALAGEKNLTPLPIGGEDCTAQAVARGGRVVLTGTAAGLVRYQSREDGATLGELTATSGAVRVVAVHPDGERFAVAGDDGAIHLARLPAEKDGESPDAEATLEGHSGPIRSLAFTADGQMLLSAGADNSVQLWNLKQHTVLETFSTHGIEPSRVCGTRNAATIVAACGSKTVFVFHRDGQKPAAKLPIRGQVRSIALAPTGTLAVGMADGGIQLWDIDRQLEIERLTGHTGNVDHLAFVGDKLLVSAAADKAVRLWILSPTVVTQAHRGAVRGLTVVEESGRFVTGGDDRRLCIWSSAGVLLREQESRVRVTGLARHPRRAQIVFRTDDSFKCNEVARWNFDDGTAIEPLRTPAAANALAFSGDGSRLAVAGADGTVRVYDSQSQTLVEEFPSVANVATLLFAPGDDRLITGENDDIFRGYSLALHRLFGLDSAATCAVFSPDAELVLAGAEDGKVRLWSLASGQLQQELKGHAGAITSVLITADGQMAFSASLDGVVRAWPLVDSSLPDEPGKSAEVFEHPRAVRSLQATTTGAMLLTGCDDGVARVWDIAQARVRESYAGEPASLIAVRFIDPEMSVLVCNGDGALSRWKRPTASEIAKGASVNLTAADAKAVPLTAVSNAAPKIAAAADDRGSEESQAQESSQMAAYEQFLRGARLSAERDKWRRKISAARGNLTTPAEKAHAESLKLNKGQAEVGKGDPWNLTPAASLETDFEFASKIGQRVELAISADGNLVAAAWKPAEPQDGAKSPGIVRVWDLPTGVELRRWTAADAGRWKRMSFAGSSDAFLYTLPDATTYDLSSGKASHFANDCLAVPIPGDDELLFSRSTRPLASGDLLVRVDGGSFQKNWGGLKGYETAVTALACSLDGRWAAVGIRERLRHKLVLFDLKAMGVSAVLDEAPHAKPWVDEGPIGISDVLFSPDGKRLFWHGQYGSEDFRATTALATGDGFKIAENTIAKLKEPLLTNHMIGYVAGALDTLYVGTSSGLRLYEGKSGKLTGEIDLVETHGGQVQYVVSPDDAWMASADDGGKVALWDLSRPKRPCNAFAAHTGPIVGLAFSADGHCLVTASEENRIRLWRLQELQDRRQRHDKRK